MERLTEFCIRARIWYHWRQIIRYRKAGLRLFDSGEKFSSARMIELNRKIDRHGMTAFRLERQLAVGSAPVS